MMDDSDLCDECGRSPYECRCDANQDCGMMPDGTCIYAGTEWCDWECGGND